MKKIICTLFIVLTASLGSFSQENVVCPNIEIVAPASTIRPGKVMRISVLLDSDSVNLDLKYHWEVDKGVIISGQQTDQIGVSTDGLENETITASVEIEGLPEGCIYKFSELGIIAEIPRILELFWEDLKSDDIPARIDALFIDLQHNPHLKAYIRAFGPPKDVRKLEKLIKDHIELRKYDENRIVFIFEGKEKTIRLIPFLAPELIDVSDLD